VKSHTLTDSPSDSLEERQYIASKAISKCPEVEVLIEGVPCYCLIDTGSEVTTVTESFFNQYLKECTVRDTTRWLKINAANSLQIPYIGYIEVDMQILGRPVNNIGVLVVKDCPPGSFSDNKKRVPGLIGSNVLKYIFESLYEVANQAFQNVIESDSSWNSAYNAYSAVHATCNNIESSSDDGHIGFVKLAGKSPVKIPANTSIAVKGTTKQLSEPYEALIETEVGGSLPNGLHIAPTFCTVVHGSVEVQVSNITNRDIWISKNQRIAEAFSASEVLPEVTVQYDSSGSPEIVFSSQCSAENLILTLSILVISLMK